MGTVILCLCVVLIASRASASVDEESPLDAKPENVVNVTALMGDEVQLPCDIQPEGQHDAVNMVMWFKDDLGTPIYSFDARASPARHWTGNSSLKSRARFQVASLPATLLIEDIRPADEGYYRCRVDFGNSPTSHTKLLLTVVASPRRMIVTDSSGKEVNTFVGPFSEGHDLQLTCQVFGGHPTPNLTWWFGNKLIESRSVSHSDGVVTSKLHLSVVNRSHRKHRFRCEANNSQLKTPLRKEIELDVYLKPTQVEIIPSAAEEAEKEGEKGGYISAGTPHEWKCRTRGAYPSVQMTWWKEGDKVQQKTVTSDEDEVINYSLTFTPRPEDDGRTLVCQVENPWIPQSKKEVRTTLRVGYSPKAILSLGTVLDPRGIKEGDDVYFECEIRANPPIHQLLWKHEGNELRHNISAGVIVSSRSLALQHVSRHDSGLYSCVASNAEGHGTSNQLALQVQYAPQCKAPGEQLVGALKHEKVSLACEVRAEPAATNFSWTYNRSREVLAIPRSRYTASPGVSELQYTPVEETDYGTLACWAHNAIGKQEKPCIFQIIPAGPPHSVETCLTVPSSVLTIEVRCIAGFDGGLPQHFLLELTPDDEADQRPVYRVVAGEPRFTLHDLEHDTNYQAVIYAVNAKGRSRAVVMKNLKLPALLEKFTGSERPFSLVSLLVPLAGTAGLILLVVVLTGIVVCTRKLYEKRHNSKTETSIDLGEDVTNVATESGNRETKVHTEVALDLLEGNPLLGPKLIKSEAMNGSTRPRSILKRTCESDL